MVLVLSVATIDIASPLSLPFAPLPLAPLLIAAAHRAHRRSPRSPPLTAAAHRRDRGRSRERESPAYKTITDRRRRISSLLLANLFVARARLVPSGAQSSPLCTSFVSVSTLVCYRTVRLYVPTHRFSRDRKDATPPSGKLRFLVAVSGHRTVRGHCW